MPLPRIRYADLIRAETPARRRRYFEDRAMDLEKEAQAEQQRQQEAALAEQERQFNESLGLQQQQIKDAQEQANISNTIAGLGLAKAGYPYLKKGLPYLKKGYDALTGLGDTGLNAGSLAKDSIGYAPQKPVTDILYPDVAELESGPTYGPVASGEAANVVNTGLEAGSLAPGSIGYAPAAEATDVLYPGLAQLEQGPAYGPLASGSSTASSGAGTGGGWLAGGGPVAAAGGLLLDVANQGPISQGIERVFGEYGLGGAISNALGIGTKTIDPAQLVWAQPKATANGVDPEFLTPQGPNIALPDPHHQYRDLYQRVFSTPEGRQLMDKLRGGSSLSPYTAGTTEFSDFIKTLQGIDKKPKAPLVSQDLLNNAFSGSVPAMY